MRQILGHHFLYHAAHRSFNLVHHADLVLPSPVPAPCRPPTFQPRARRRPAPICPSIGAESRRPPIFQNPARRLAASLWPSIGCIIMPSSDLSTSRTTPSGSDLTQHVFLYHAGPQSFNPETHRNVPASRSARRLPPRLPPSTSPKPAGWSRNAKAGPSKHASHQNRLP
jgi:hypothetical protein